LRLVARILVVAFAVCLLSAPLSAQADEIRDRQWHIAALGIAAAQTLSQGDGVLVAVADTGVDARRGELTGAVIAGKEFGEQANGDGRTDTDGHGTAMAGLIAGRGLADGSGVLGVAPRARILPVRTIRSEFGGSPTDLGAGIEWAVSQGAQVICIAAGTGEYPEIKQAVETAVRADVVVVASAGNRPTAEHVAFPANIPGVLAVAGTDKSGDHAAISAAGPEVVLAAPAVDIVSTGAFGKYVTGEGTSNSTAIVAGAVALVRAKFPGLSAVEVIRRLTATATDRGKPGRDDEYGYGIVNPVAALTADLPSSAHATGVGSGGVGERRGGVGVGWVLVGVGMVGGVAVWWLRRRTR
jgi:type VII secretion-associated serine protease mycosin